jgi:hypothetical protein
MISEVVGSSRFPPQNARRGEHGTLERTKELDHAHRNRLRGAAGLVLSLRS